MRNKNIHIRKAILSDYNDLREIYHQVRTNEFSWVDNNGILLNDFDTSTEGEIIFVAVVENKIAGFISIWEEDKFIHNLFVSKFFRKYGLGKALLDKAKLVFGTPLKLKCVKENQNSIQFYLANGWTIEKEEMGSEGLYYLMCFNRAQIKGKEDKYE